MPRVAALLCSRRTPQIAVLALMSFGFAGCSADMTTRFSQNQAAPSQPGHFGWQRDTTSAVASAAPTTQVERQELPRQQTQPTYQTSSMPPVISAPQTYPVAGGVSGGGRGIASYS